MQQSHLIPLLFIKTPNFPLCLTMAANLSVSAKILVVDCWTRLGWAGCVLVSYVIKFVGWVQRSMCSVQFAQTRQAVKTDDLAALYFCPIRIAVPWNCYPLLSPLAVPYWYLKFHNVTRSPQRSLDKLKITILFCYFQ